VGSVAYSMSVSLDGFVADADGSIDWVIVDDELHDAFNDEARAAGIFLYGRRMYELMTAYWPTAEDDPAATPVMVDFARIWKPKPKLVASSTLTSVNWNAHLVPGDVVDEVARLRGELETVISVGGPTVAAALLRAGLVDEVAMYVNPVVLGGGVPFFPPDLRLSLRLVESRRFPAGVQLLRYVPA
jgi:dihydrofolate reductase